MFFLFNTYFLKNADNQHWKSTCSEKYKYQKSDHKDQTVFMLLVFFVF